VLVTWLSERRPWGEKHLVLVSELAGGVVQTRCPCNTPVPWRMGLPPVRPLDPLCFSVRVGKENRKTSFAKGGSPGTCCLLYLSFLQKGALCSRARGLLCVYCSSGWPLLFCVMSISSLFYSGLLKWHILKQRCSLWKGFRKGLKWKLVVTL